MEPLGARKPSELLDSLLEICPRGLEANVFVNLLLERLPAELQIMLGEDNHLDLCNLAAKADKQWTLHGFCNTGSEVSVAVSLVLEPANMAAVAPRGYGPSGLLQRNRGGGQRLDTTRVAGATSGQPAPKAPANPSNIARVQSGLCYYLWRRGNQATKCEAPCTWGKLAHWGQLNTITLSQLVHITDQLSHRA
jgi:hypothetical protein